METYQRKTKREHVLYNPTMYIGGIDSKPMSGYVFNMGTQKMEWKEDMNYNEGLLKIIFEALDNAFDNALRDPPTTSVWLNLEKLRVTVTNNGKHIPIKKQDFGNGVNDYIPTVIFGDCLTGSNFNDDREGTGMNGIGIKAANILSKEFTVECYDPVEKQTFSQTWLDNMSVVNSPIIRKKSKPTEKTTKVTFKPKLDIFKVKSLLDFEDFIVTRLVEIAATHKKIVKVYYNGKRIHITNFKSYFKSFLEDKERFVFDSPQTNFEYGLKVSKTGTFEHSSFVNTLHTTGDKSTHVRLVLNKAVSFIQGHLSKKYSKKNGGVKLDRNVIINKLHIFVNIHMKKPLFTSQTKVELSSPVKPEDYPVDGVKIARMVKKSGILDVLEELLNKKALDVMQRDLGSNNKKRTVNIDKLDDAKNAGTHKSKDCVLFIVEGDSAKTFASIGLSVIGRKNYGVFPIKGKVVNVRKATDAKVKANAEIKNIMKILGLSFTRKYDNAEDMKSLRYGGVCLLTDSDSDGSHISGLLLNFFHNYWPALLKNNDFVFRFVTPMIKIENKRNKKDVHGFFTITEFNKFCEINDISKYHVQHLKGLGTSEQADTLRYFKNMDKDHLKHFTGTENMDQMIDNIFNKNTNWRKEWITDSKYDAEMDFSKPTMDMTTYLNSELRDFSKYAMVRAIASVIDGFKTSQRKIFFAAINKFRNNGNQKFKVAQLGAHAAALTNYAHGEVSLQEAIIKMAQDFPGSNNMNLMEPRGAFGSRLANGDDAASPRYIFTRLADYTTNIFSPSDDRVLKNVIDEGMSVEPKYYTPALPMVLINGARGIGTAFSSYVPSFNPDDIRNIVLDKIQNPDVDVSKDDPLPWFRGYSTNDRTTFDGSKWIFYGNYEIIGQGKIVIDELPIYTAIDAYKSSVLGPLLESKLITKIDIEHDIARNKPRFIIQHNLNTNNEDDIMKTLKLIKTTPSTNMNLLDENNCLINFKSVKEIVNYWYKIKFDQLNSRKEAVLNDMENDIHMHQHKLLFLNGVLENKIKIKESKQSVINDMSKLEISEKYHDQFLKIPIVNLTADMINTLTNAIKNKRRDHDELKLKSVSDIFKEDVESIFGGKTKKRKAITNTSISSLKKFKT